MNSSAFRHRLANLRVRHGDAAYVPCAIDGMYSVGLDTFLRQLAAGETVHDLRGFREEAGLHFVGGQRKRRGLGRATQTCVGAVVNSGGLCITGTRYG